MPEYVVRHPINYTSPRAQWMVTKCKNNTTNGETKDKCEKPRLDPTFDFIVPVTDASSNVVYRNIFCAHCNGITDSSDLRIWDFELGCDDVLQLPEKNILSKMEEFNCSIMFNPPVDLYLEYCSIPSYSISRCNETGLWPVYDAMTDLACNAFMDPFNFTYKNYFCYACNVRTPLTIDELWCTDAWFDIDIGDFTPSFSAILNLDKIRRWENDEILNCDTARQFEDYKLVRIISLHQFKSSCT